MSGGTAHPELISKTERRGTVGLIARTFGRRRRDPSRTGGPQGRGVRPSGGPAHFGTVLAEELCAIRLRRWHARRDRPPDAVVPPPEPRGRRSVRDVFERIKAFFSKWRRRRGSRVADGPPGPGPTSPPPELEERVARERALDMNLVGLSFSGGGIRSATFNLGVLQGLARFGLLKNFDYLSTVSGGGYIGSWFSSWIWRESSLANVEKQLRPSRVEQAKAARSWWGGLREGAPTSPDIETRILEEEPEPIYHLRMYSNYLTPRTGLFSVDTWALFAIYLRNFLLNQLVLLPAALVLLMIPRYFLLLFRPSFVENPWRDNVLCGLMIALALFAFYWLAHLMINLRWARAVERNRGGGGIATAGGPPRDRWFPRGTGALHALILGPLLVSAVLLCQQFRWLPGDRVGLGPPLLRGSLEFLGGWVPDAWSALKPALSFGTFVMLLVLLVRVYVGIIARPLALLTGQRARGSAIVSLVLIGSMVAFCAGTLLYATLEALFRAPHAAPGSIQELMATPHLLVLGPAAAFLVFVVGAILEVGLLSEALDEDSREWWASLKAWFLLYALLWAGLVGVALFGRYWLAVSGIQVRRALAGTWLVTAASGVLAAWSPSTQSKRRSGLRESVARITPPVFLVGVLFLVSALASMILDRWALLAPWGTDPQSPDVLRRYWEQVLALNVGWLTSWSVGLALVALVMFSIINVNTFSLHDLYANRLIRCFLGASRPREVADPRKARYAPSNCKRPVRRPNPLTGFDLDDDLTLNDLAINPRHKPSGKGYLGPFYLVNTAMNLVQGDELSWQERKAESFVLSPVYCGSKSTGYRRLPEFGGDLRLGRAVSISGAAASPNMGYHSSPAVTALMTIFNVRLGWWLGNPAFSKWRNPGPGMGMYLFDELSGRTSSQQDYVYLSDGGHFENLGVYELARRRCRFILACDAGADPDFDFYDLASLVRKCRSDLGVRIEIDTAPLKPQGDGRRSRWHCAIGKIHYEDVDPQAIPGILVYLKPSLSGDEPSDILNYSQQNPSFPHQPTSDQFFSESQFESYRALGDHIVTEVFRDAVRDAGNDLDRTDGLFAELRRRWFPPPPDLEKNFRETARAFIGLARNLRDDARLSELSQALYPELAQAPPPLDGQPREAELHAVSQMLHVMEEAWISDQLEGYHNHPMNRGWMNAFRRWTRSEPLQRHWATLRGEFTEDFVRFCERELYLSFGPARARRMHIPAEVLPTPDTTGGGGGGSRGRGENGNGEESGTGAGAIGSRPRRRRRRRVGAGDRGGAIGGEGTGGAAEPRPISGGAPEDEPPSIERFNPEGESGWAGALRPLDHEYRLEWSGTRLDFVTAEGDGLRPLIAEANRAWLGLNPTGGGVGPSPPVTPTVRPATWLITIPTGGRAETAGEGGRREPERVCGLILLWKRASGARFDLRLMPSLNSSGDIVETGKGLIVVAAVNDTLHFRIFDRDGERIIDTDETRLAGCGQQIDSLRRRLETLWPPHELTPAHKGEVIAEVAAVVDLARSVKGPAHAGGARAPRPPDAKCSDLLGRPRARFGPRGELDPERYELFIWLQGPYRTQGLGRQALAQALEEFWGEHCEEWFLIRALYPSGRSGSGDRWQSNVWLNFFHHFAFRNEKSVAPPPKGPSGGATTPVESGRDGKTTTPNEPGMPAPSGPVDLIVERHFHPADWIGYQEALDEARRLLQPVEELCASSRFAPMAD